MNTKEILDSYLSSVGGGFVLTMGGESSGSPFDDPERLKAQQLLVSRLEAQVAISWKLFIAFASIVVGSGLLGIILALRLPQTFDAAGVSAAIAACVAAAFALIAALRKHVLLSALVNILSAIDGVSAVKVVQAVYAEEFGKRMPANQSPEVKNGGEHLPIPEGKVDPDKDVTPGPTG